MAILVARLGRILQQLVEEGQRLALGHADDALKTVDRFRHSAT
jgi:hypothetical protein